MAQNPNLKMPFAQCWQKLLTLIVQPIINLLQITKPISVANLNTVPVSANTNIISTDATKQLYARNPPCLFRIYVVFQGAGTLTLYRTTSGQAIPELLNAGGQLSANTAYLFDVLVDQGEKIDFQYSAGTVLSKLSVVEKDDVK